MYYEIEGLETGIYFEESLNQLFYKIRESLGTESLKYLKRVLKKENEALVSYWYIETGTSAEVWNTMLDLAKV